MQRASRSSLNRLFLRYPEQNEALLSPPPHTRLRRVNERLRALQISILYKSEPSPGPMSHPGLALRLR